MWHRLVFPRLHTLLLSAVRSRLGTVEERSGTSLQRPTRLRPPHAPPAPAHHTTGPRLLPGSLPSLFLFYSPLVPLAAPLRCSPHPAPGPAGSRQASPPAKAVGITSAQGSPSAPSCGLREPRHNDPRGQAARRSSSAPGRSRVWQSGCSCLFSQEPRPPASRRQPPHREDRRPGTGRSGTARRGGGSAPARRAPSGPAGSAATALSPCGALAWREAAAPRLSGRLRMVRGRCNRARQGLGGGAVGGVAGARRGSRGSRGGSEGAS